VVLSDNRKLVFTVKSPETTSVINAWGYFFEKFTG
jgi:hypothetical protein